MEQDIGYCQASDGITIAYAVAGSGPPLIRTGMWFTHLEEELNGNSFLSLWEALAEHFTLIRYDMRGTGLSERNIIEYNENQLVDDHVAVLNATGFESSDILGFSQGAIVAWLVAEAVPSRVKRIITVGGYDRGVAHRPKPDGGPETVETFASIMRTGWGSDDPSFRNVFSSQFLPSSSKEELDWFSNFQKLSSSPDIAEKNYRFFANMDLSKRVKKIRHSHLLIHASGDRRVPISIARSLSAKIQNCKLVTIDTNDHVPDKTPEDRLKLYNALSEYLGVEIRERNAQRLTSVLDSSVEKIESSRLFKIAVIIGVIVTLISAIALLL
jgi:pimeloyl-ACP methyl ester carboxylesterase